MKIYYDDSDGRIIALNYDKDDFLWNNTINVSFSVLEIDEIDLVNKDLCRDLIRIQGAGDINGDGKYYISAGELYVRDNWEEHIEDII